MSRSIQLIAPSRGAAHRLASLGSLGGQWRRWVASSGNQDAKFPDAATSHDPHAFVQQLKASLKPKSAAKTAPEAPPAPPVEEDSDLDDSEEVDDEASVEGSERGHVAVMQGEVVELLSMGVGGGRDVFIDCTVGGGSHLAAVLEASSGAATTAIGMDRDPNIINTAAQTLQSSAPGRAALVRSSFSRLPWVARMLGLDEGRPVDGGSSVFDWEEPLRSLAQQLASNGWSLPMALRGPALLSCSAAERQDSLSAMQPAAHVERKRGSAASHAAEVARRVVVGDGDGGEGHAFLAPDGPRRLQLGRAGDQPLTEEDVMEARTPTLPRLAGVLFDLGLNSAHVDEAERGFSFRRDGPLDMRFDPSNDACPTASWVVSNASHTELARIFKEYGSEENAEAVAAAIVRWRGKGRDRRAIVSTLELRLVIEMAMTKVAGLPDGQHHQRWQNRRMQQQVRKGGKRRSKPGEGSKAAMWRSGKEREKAMQRLARRKPSHLDTLQRCFQALRIAVNDERVEMKRALASSINAIPVGGVLAVISFQPGEDRVLQRLMGPRVHHAAWRELTPAGALRPQTVEVRANPRARSAHLRAYQRVKPVSQARVAELMRRRRARGAQGAPPSDEEAAVDMPALEVMASGWVVHKYQRHLEDQARRVARGRERNRQRQAAEREARRLAKERKAAGEDVRIVDDFTGEAFDGDWIDGDFDLVDSDEEEQEEGEEGFYFDLEAELAKGRSHSVQNARTSDGIGDGAAGGLDEGDRAWRAMLESARPPQRGQTVAGADDSWVRPEQPMQATFDWDSTYSNDEDWEEGGDGTGVGRWHPVDDA